MTKRFHLSHLLPALWLLFTLFACEKQEKVINKPDKPNQGQTVTPSNPNQTENLPKVDVVVTTLQKATIGKGYNIILMGMGFTEEHVRSGIYDRLMKRSQQYFFSVEPMNSLRFYFNVYAVRSKVEDIQMILFANEFNEQESQQSKYSSIANSRARAMALSVPGFKKENSVTCVIVNSTAFWGYAYMDEPTLAYSAISSDSIYLQSLILHEAVGHCIGKLDDEYSSRSSCGSKDHVGKKQKDNWGMNTSLTNDPEKVPWAQFLKDKRYASEDLGVYEGGAGCFKEGVWRPSKTSIMKSGSPNSIKFNAPSRRAIYDHVMQVTTGRTPTYEEFVQFDLAHKK